jgi:Flp pilus assembly protein TadB
MLSHEDRRRLTAIEQQMQIDDPAFARLFTRRSAAGMGWQRAATAVAGMLCGLAAIAGVLTGSVLLFFLLFVSSATIAVAARWPIHRPRRRTR